jgi:CheY-like chemotaxis protein
LTDDQKTELIVVDLHNQKIDFRSLARALKASDSSKSALLLGFFSHVETDLQKAALEAGFDRVIPRSLFSRDLASILQGEVR